MKKKKFLKTFLIIVAVFIVLIAAVCVWQKDNITAALNSQKYTQEEIADKITDSKQTVQQTIEKYNLPIVRDFTFEEEEKIRKGELTVEEAMQLIYAQPTQTDENDADVNNNNDDSNKTQQVQTDPASAIVADYITQVYSLKAYYIGQLGNVESEMRQVYNQSGKDKSKIAGIVKSYLPRIASMESECDKKIDALLSSLRADLNAIGADTSVADQIQEAYINEKSLRKSYYLSQY